MTDPDPDALELASAYLDGEVTAAERARVEADPALLADVERLRLVREAVGVVSPAPSGAREAAIAAALSAFDERGDHVQAPPDVVPLGRRRSARRVQTVGAAAAAVVLIVGGFVIINRESGDDSAHDSQSAQIVTASGAVATMSDFEAAADEPLSASPMETSAREPALDAAEARAEPAASPAVIRDAAELRAAAKALAGELRPLEEVVDDCERSTGAADPDAVFQSDEGAAVEVFIAATSNGLAAISTESCEIVLRAT